MQEPRFNLWAGKIPLEEGAWQPTPVFFPGESHRQRSLVGYSPWGRKELDMTEWVTHLGSQQNSAESTVSVYSLTSAHHAQPTPASTSRYYTLLECGFISQGYLWQLLILTLFFKISHRQASFCNPTRSQVGPKSLKPIFVRVCVGCFLFLLNKNLF